MSKSITVRNTDELRTAMEAGYTKDEIVIGAHDNTSALEEARAEGKAEGEKSGSASAIAAERKRIADINALAMTGFDKERDDAISSGASAADFSIAQTKAMKDRGTSRDDQKNDATRVAAANNSGGGAGTPKTNPFAKSISKMKGAA
jgi:hypothetical protein